MRPNTDPRDQRRVSLGCLVVVAIATLFSQGCTMREWYVQEDRATYEALRPYVEASLAEDLAKTDEELAPLLEQLEARVGAPVEREDLEAQELTLDAWAQRLRAEEEALAR